LFDESTWKTHILSTAAAVMCEALLEASSGKSLEMVDAKEMLRRELDVDVEAAEVSGVLEFMRRLGVIVS
jgi:hypothetical protein